MHLYHYTGASALSDFRAEKLLQRLQAAFLHVTQVAANYVYFVESAQEIDASSQQDLMALLQARHNQTISPPPNSYLIVPRLGTISPWSSKATDILHQAGFDNIRRVERGVLYCLQTSMPQSDESHQRNACEIAALLHDKMTESVLYDWPHINTLFMHQTPTPVREINILQHGKAALIAADQELGLALSEQEMDYMLTNFRSLKRNPSDVELMMFAQINSEHCRHKIFNADWVIDDKPQDDSLFKMIRHTHAKHPQGVLSAYEDNGAVLAGSKAARFWADVQSHVYRYHLEEVGIVIKVETHNHPTAISPFAGAATGSGGEIRDEGAVGRGALPKAGLTGFSVSNLRIPDFIQPWEIPYGKPRHIASALDIMLEAPIGAAAFNNEFGRPGICGYFRTYETTMRDQHGAVRGYHKPIMIAGGLGNIRLEQIEKKTLSVGAKLIVLGGPAMLIGMGGGAASSMASGSQQEALDFASVQRGNPEIQRRCQEVINACWSLGEENPILSIHDVGAGGLSNAIPELLEASKRGGKLLLRDIPRAESGLSPMEIWCNEAQERYVLAITAENLATFRALAVRERCPFAVVGEATEARDLILEDSDFENKPINLSIGMLLGNTPKLVRKVEHNAILPTRFDISQIDLQEAVERVLKLPCVADKSFLITIGDRSVTGMIARDPMVGPWQTPVADVAVTANSFTGYTGEAMAMGERAPIALLHHAASARMAVGEAITNMAAAYIEDITQIKLSANWMAASGYAGEDAGLYDAVQTIALELCPALGISIPVGKDSLSMRTIWEEGGQNYSVIAPLSVVISAFAPVTDVRKTLTPELQRDLGETDLILIDLGEGNYGLGGSALAQVYQSQDSIPPDVNNPMALKNFFTTIQTLNRDHLIAAYHDRSDGGLFVILCEMAFAAHVGLDICLDGLGKNPTEALFSEELGAVIQVRRADVEKVMACLKQHELDKHSHVIGGLNHEDVFRFSYENKVILQKPRIYFQQLWSETSYRLQALRDNPVCVQQAFETIEDTKNPGLNVCLTFDLSEDVAAPFIKTGVRPKVAVLREQGVNGQVEMAAAFDRAGFMAVDVHMTDILSGQTSLQEFVGLAVSGGFSYGDVLGAGRGWAQTILHHEKAKDAFAAYFARTDTFALGTCNGCQMLSQLKSIIPGSAHWPLFLRNQSEQFESRLSLLEIKPSPSIFFRDMVGSRICMAVAHGEGRAVFDASTGANHASTLGLVTACYVDHYGIATERYPSNPNGSPLGIAGLTSQDGRVTVLMPHPERVFRSIQNSWHPSDWAEDAPTMRMFRNARVWVG